MILSQATYEAAIGFVENKDPPDGVYLPEWTRKRILNSTVQLNGTNRGGDGTFIGSGAIINVNPDGVTILTALHNVSTWAEGVAGWQDMLDAFGEKVKIYYSGKDLTFNGTAGKIALIDSVASFGGSNTPTNYYDLLVVTSSDRALKAYAREFVFNNADDTIKKEARFIAGSYASLLNMRKYHYVQCGYGKKSDTRNCEILSKARPPRIVVTKTITKASQDTVEMTANQLHYRRTNPANKDAPTNYYNQEAGDGALPRYKTFQSALWFSGREMSTTAEGDSGGPLYAIDRATRTKAYLIGVTTGADMYPKPQPTRAVFRNTILTATRDYMASIE